MSSITKNNFGCVLAKSVSRRYFTMRPLCNSTPLLVGFMVNKVAMKGAYFGLTFHYHSTNVADSFINHRRYIHSCAA